MPHQGLQNPKDFPSLLSYAPQPWNPAPLRHLLSPAKTSYFSLLGKDMEAPLSGIFQPRQMPGKHPNKLSLFGEAPPGPTSQAHPPCSVPPYIQPYVYITLGKRQVLPPGGCSSVCALWERRKDLSFLFVSSR